ncbi:hypothetical protein CDD82_923 [Ophiocordyceps australis]|uniref:Uncharacterized protein n=1 Tax=Ophiocordyceps australis TaxID=1399860 RepID=A0A2C5YES2_9HYPO|nr:hypothetical protein CDD82_923 [Ophiocordyceps australis]
MAADAKPRPSRSNSFQRMLQLEKQYMLERLQANKSELPSPASPSMSARQPCSPPASPRRSSIQARRAHMHVPMGSEDDGHHAVHPSQSPIRRPAPLVIRTDSTWSPQSETTLEQQLSMGHVPAMAPSHTDISSPGKVVAFEFPPQEMDQRSICVSPSWEAHGRRKKEKKMMEKQKMEKQKHEAAKANEGRVRRARLSKPPPPTVATAPKSTKEAQTESNEPRGRQKERSSDPVDAKRSSKDGMALKKTRSRSSSFVSLMRSPFEFRRSSADSSEPEFIGGIKLELERHVASENMLQGAQRGIDLENQSRFQDSKAKKRWSSPLKSPPPARSLVDSQDPTRRAYPPITRYTKATKTRSLISPSTPPAPDMSKIDKWRARVGLRPASRSTMRTPEPDSPLTNESIPRGGRAAETTTRPQITTAPGGLTTPLHSLTTPSTNTATDDKSVAEVNAKRRSHVTFAHSPRPTVRNGENKTEKDLNNNESIQSSSDSRSGPSTGYQTAPSTPPPDPPNRSPERHPLKMHGVVASGSGSFSSSTETPQMSVAATQSELSVPESMTPKQKEKATAVSDTVSNSSLTPKAAPVPAFKMSAGNGSRESMQRLGPTFIRKPTSMQYHPTTQVLSPTTRNMPFSSSEESSEELHSPSPPSTPATSRAESEKGLYLPNSFTPTPVNGSAGNSIKGADMTDEEDQCDVQAAAEKMLASLSQAAASSMANQRRGKSESFLIPEKAPLPVHRAQPSRSHVRGSTLAFATRVSAPQSRDQSPKPAPAAYLEEARKMPPNMPPTRASRQRLGPPASFVLPRNMSSPTMLSESSRSSDTIGRSGQHTSTASLGQQEKDPLAKVFVECCSCKFYHDMPSNLYEAMANPEGVLSGRDTLGYSGSISMTIKCPWCKHEMSTKCCAGLAAMVYVKERLH